MMFGKLFFTFALIVNVAFGDRNTFALHRELEAGEELGTLEKPFIFFHLEKTGGSTLRSSFNEIYKKKDKLSMIPCKNMRCEIEASSLVTEEFLNVSSCAVAFLGHFDPTLTLNALWAIDQGHYGPVKCNRGWSNLKKDIGLLPIGRPPPLLRAEEVKQLVPHVDCTIILREPLSQRWSFYYFFEYHKNHVEQFSEFYKKDTSHWLFSDFVYWKILQGMEEKDYSIDMVKVYLEQCHTGVQESYVDYYNDLRVTIPELPTAEHLQHQNPSTRFLDPIEAKKLDPNSLSMTERTSLANASRKDGQIWALARDYYQGHGKKVNRTKGFECDLVCWDIEGNYWLPEPIVGGKCAPCRETKYF